MVAKQKSRILIADDHPMMRDALRNMIGDDPTFDITGEAGTGPEVMDLARQADTVILDLQMPGTDGIELIKQLRAQYTELRILILTVYSEHELAVRCFRAGASGFLNKTSDPSQILEALRRVAAGRKYASEAVLERLLFELDGGEQGLPHESLSDREYQVLRLLASGRTVTQIADELSLSVKTVSTYRRRVMDKMNMGSTVELMRYALREGIVG